MTKVMVETMASMKKPCSLSCSNTNSAPGIPAVSVWIHSIQITPAESNIQFEFLLWDRQQAADYEQNLEDLIYQSERNGQRIIYQPANLHL